MLNFQFLEKGLGLVSSTHFVYDFPRKMFLILHFITEPNFISDCLYFSRYGARCVLKQFVNQAVMS